MLAVSGFIGLMGLINLSFGLYQRGNGLNPKTADYGFRLDASGYSGPTIFIGVLALITAAFGLATYRWKNPCVAVPFGCATLFVGLALLILGALVDGFGEAVSMEGFRERGCSGFPEVKQAYTQAVDKAMCSELCPCDQGASS